MTQTQQRPSPRAIDLLDRFPAGKAPLMLVAIVLAAGGWLAAHPARTQRSDLRTWVFSPEHRDNYVALASSFTEAHQGRTVSVEHVEHRAIDQRMRAALRAGLEVPDLVEVEITQAGSFFAGPIEDVGFVDLKPLLERDGLLDRIPAARLAPYTREGRIFGLPHDVHPVMLAYRRDVFEAEGVDAAAIETWDDLVAVGRRLTRRGGSGVGPRYLLQLPAAAGWGVEICLFQRGGGYFDAEGRLTMDDETAVQTVAWYVPLVAGPDAIAFDLNHWSPEMTKAMADGFTLMYLCPDWRSRNFENKTREMLGADGKPALAGKMALMPLPAVARGGRRTSTWGGTMLGITRRSRDVELAWSWAKHIYATPQGWTEQFSKTGIIAPVREAWALPVLAEPSAFWSGQATGAAFAELIPDVPPQHGSPYLNLAKQRFGDAVSACARHYAGAGPAGFVDVVRATLRREADIVRREMARNVFMRGAEAKP